MMSRRLAFTCCIPIVLLLAAAPAQTQVFAVAPFAHPNLYLMNPLVGQAVPPVLVQVDHERLDLARVASAAASPRPAIDSFILASDKARDRWTFEPRTGRLTSTAPVYLLARANVPWLDSHPLLVEHAPAEGSMQASLLPEPSSAASSGLFMLGLLLRRSSMGRS